MPTQAAHRNDPPSPHRAHAHPGHRRSATAPRQRARLALVTAAVAMAAAACSLGDPGTDVVAAGQETDADAVTATTVAPTTAAPPEFRPVATWTWTLEADGGFRTEGTLELGEVGRVGNAPPLPDFDDPATTLALACDGFDPQTDAVIPARQSLRNATDAFDVELANTFYLATDQADGVLFASAPDDLLRVAAGYSSGTDCADVVLADEAWFGNGSGWGLSFDDPAGPDEVRGPHHAYLILPDYYSPATPDGDVERLAGTGLAIVPAMSKEERQLVDLSGPDTDWGRNGGVLLLGSTAPGGAADAAPAESDGDPADGTSDGDGEEPPAAPETSTPQVAPSPPSTPSAPPVTTADAPPTPDGCPTLAAGTWSGDWRSDGGSATGGITAEVTVSGDRIGGSVEVRGSAFIPGGAISGMTSCADIEFGRVDELVDFDGELAEDGTTISGRYTAYQSGVIADTGDFDLRVER